LIVFREAIDTGQQVERGAIVKMQQRLTQLAEAVSPAPEGSLVGQKRDSATKAKEVSKEQSGSCCTPLDDTEQTPEAKAQSSSCCGPVDTQQAHSQDQPVNVRKPVYSGWVTAETMAWTRRSKLFMLPRSVLPIQRIIW